MPTIRLRKDAPGWRMNPWSCVAGVSHDRRMSVSPNFTIVTLGVADLERSAAFYRGLGWEQRGDLSAGITWFRTAGTWIGLFG